MVKNSILISLLFVVCFFFSITGAVAQKKNKIDSIIEILIKVKKDTSTISTFIAAGDYYLNEKKDTAVFYYYKALSLAKELNEKMYSVISYRCIGKYYSRKNNYDSSLFFYNKSLVISEQISDSSLIAKNFSNIGLIYYYKEDYINAMLSYQKSIDIRIVIKDKKGVSDVYNNISNVYDKIGELPKALDFLHMSLKIKNEIGDKDNSAACMNNIAGIQMNLKSYDLAYEYAFNALKISKEVDNKKRMLECFLKLYSVFYEKYINSTNVDARMQFLDSAIFYNEETIKISHEIGNDSGLSSGKLNAGIIFTEKKEYDKALDLLKEGMDVAVKLNQKATLILFYNQIAQVYIYQKRYDNALQYLDKSLTLAEDLKSDYYKQSIFYLLSVSYEGKGDLTNSLSFYKKFKEAQDRLNDINNFKKLSTHAAKMQFDFKIDLLEKEKALQVLENKRQQIIIFSIIAGLALLAIFTIFIIQRLRITRRQKRIIENQKKLVDQKNEILNQQKEEIEAQRDEIAGQHEIVITQKKHIEEIHTELKDSILYARRIQKAVLPADDLTEMFLANYFILFEPKDIVSGDFYWTIIRKNWLLVTVADCTGHGVPGAFMSMLGISFLNEIVAREDITTAGSVLNELREYVIKSLQQKGMTGEQKDGMDIVFIAVDLETYTMHFAGANNPLWLIRKNDKCSTEVNGLSNVNIINNDESCLIEFKPSKMPIGIHETMNSFADYVFQLQRGDILYLSSDGFEDQFGGPKNKKFLSKNLKKLLLANSDLSLSEQKQLLIDALNEWKGNNEQVDDITIVGIKI